MSKKFTQEEKEIIKKCQPVDHIKRMDNGSFSIENCPVLSCRFCLLFEILSLRSEVKKWFYL